MPTLTFRKRRFPTNQDLTSPSVLSLVDHSSATLSADAYISIPDPANPGQWLQYAFLFWNVMGQIATTSTTIISDIGTQPVTATAWYWQTGGTGPGTGVTTYTLSQSQDQIVTDCPIASVAPAGAWVGGSATFVATAAAAVQITAKTDIGQEEFNTWIVLGSGSASGNVLSVPKAGWTAAIAAYTVVEKKFKFPPLDIREAVSGVRMKILEVGDPADDVARLGQRINTAKRTLALAADELSGILGRLGQMDSTELAAAETEVRARLARLEGTVEVIQAALKGTQSP